MDHNLSLDLDSFENNDNLNKSFGVDNDLEKAKAMPIGTINKYGEIKTADGWKWIKKEKKGAKSDVGSFDNWSTPDIDTLKKEFRIEHEMKGHHFWKDEKEFLQQAKNGKVVSLSNAEDKKMGYRTHTSSFDNLHSLIKTYKSYPKYRNEDTLKSLYSGFKDNKSMQLPIVVDFGTHKRIFGGNTRLDVAFQLGVSPKVFEIKAGE